jgi:hypothetical protein
MELKHEFDNWEEYSEAMEHLEDYHDCEKCHGKIVAISMDNCGNTICGYCKQIVKYPKMKKAAFEKLLKELNTKGGHNSPEPKNLGILAKLVK